MNHLVGRFTSVVKGNSFFWLLAFGLTFSNCANSGRGEAHTTEKEEVVATGNEVVLKLPPTADNPRNSEGDFVKLKDGRILFIYSYFTSGDGDYASAYLAGRYSDDGGKTWSREDTHILQNDGGLNIMSVSLLRLQNDDIVLFYAKKNSHTDCRPWMRISKDEGKTWSDPVECIADVIAYYVLNNDRVIQLEEGRLLMPVSMHEAEDQEWSNGGVLRTYYSDDNGVSWVRGSGIEKIEGVIFQEPGVIDLKDGRIMMFIRTDGGVQYLAYSNDKGESWSSAIPSKIASPVSPASIERIPSTGDLLMVWNNNGGSNPDIAGKRTPYNAAVSKDEGKTWSEPKTIAGNPDGWYCYTAIDFTEDKYVLLGYCGGDRTQNNGLAETHISRLSLDWIYDNSH